MFPSIKRYYILQAKNNKNHDFDLSEGEAYGNAGIDGIPTNDNKRNNYEFQEVAAGTIPQPNSHDVDDFEPMSETMFRRISAGIPEVYDWSLFYDTR